MDSQGHTPSRMQMGTSPNPSTPVSAPYVSAPRSTIHSLPPYKRAQILLQEMAGLTVRLLELAGNKSWQGGHQKSIFPQFLAGAPVPLEGLAASTTKEVLELLDTHQTRLSEAVSEISELHTLEQEKQRISDTVAAYDVAIRGFAKGVRDAVQVLEFTLEEYEEFKRPPKENAGIDIGLGSVDVSELVSYAHKISYTTFAPPDYLLGQPGALAPAPQEQQMRASQLYHFSDMDLGLMKPAISPTTTDALPIKDSGRVTPSSFVMPPGLPPGLKLPPMPAGWKPGDPVPMLEQGLVPAPQGAAPAPILAPAQQQQPHYVRYVQLDLNPELESDHSEYSDEEQSSSEDDE